MRTTNRNSRYPIIRRSFRDLEEVGEVINRSRSYVSSRLVGRGDFTHREKLMILDYLGMTKDELYYYFPEQEARS